MIAIHRGSDILLEVGVNQGSIRRFNLMKEDFIRLKFSLATNIPLLIGDYVDLTDYINSCDNENFRIKDEKTDQSTKLFVLDRNYYPTFNKETGGWDYDVQINAYYHLWKNKIFMFNPSKGAAESSFSLTDTIDKHVELVVKNLASAELKWDANTEYSASIQKEAQTKGMKPITYSAVSIYSALDMIAQAFECEWWLDGGSTIYFGYRKGDETTTLTLNDEIADASISDSDGVHATRIYAFGGTTNVPKHYRDKLEFKVSEIVNTPVGNTFRDTSKPITSDWFRGKYSEQPTVMNFNGETIDSSAYICQKYYNAPLSAGHFEGTIKGLSLTFEPTIYGYYEDSDIWPSLDLEVALDVTDENWLYRQTKQVLLRKCSTMNGTNIEGVYHGNFKYSDGTLKKYTSNTESGNGMIGISSFPIEAGKYYAVHIEDTAYSELLDYFVLFSESNVAEGIAISELWSFDKKKKYGFYYKAEKNGYLLIPQPSYTGATPIVKEVERVQYSLFESPYSFEWIYDTINWSNVLLRVDIKDSANGQHDLATSVYHNVKYRVIASDWSIETQRTDKAVDTLVVIGGKERQCTINPTFAPLINGHLIKIDGYTPKIGDVFTFPNIVINRVEPSYFSQEDGGVQNGVVQKNLMLPIGTNYVQADGVADANVVEAIMVYDWIYPKTALKVTAVDPFPEWKVEIEDGQTIDTTTYDITLPIEDYEDDLWVDPSKMFAIFQSGKAAGLRFELNYIKKTKNDVTFRLVPNEDYSITVPNEATIPATDDEIILEGIDVSFLSGSAITNAENELLTQANKDILETSKEDKVVDITLTSIDAYNRGRIALGTLTSLVGVLSSENGAYDSRVLGFEECLDIPWDKPKYIIGDRNYYNRQASIESKLENIEKGSITLSGVNIGGGGSNIPIIKVKDSTKPTDANVYSALRSREEFAKRKEEETFSEKVTFNKDIDVKGSTKTKSLSVSNDANIGGNQTIGGTQEVKGIQTLHKGFKTHDFFQQGDIIQGAQVDTDGNAAFTSITSPVMQIYELQYNRKTAVQEEFIFSDGDTIETVTYIQADGTEIDSTVYNGEEYSYIRLGVRKQYEGYMTTFKDEDVLYASVNVIGESGQPATTGKCWMRVLALNNDLGVEPISSDGLFINAILYSESQCPASVNMAPTPHMVISRHGNANGTLHPERQSVFIISTKAENIVQLRGINSPIIPDTGAYAIVSGKLPSTLLAKVQKAAAFISENDPVNYARYGIFENLIQLDHEGLPIKTENYRGEWKESIATDNELNEAGMYVNRYKNTATTYDTVTHNGSLWACQVSDTTIPPSDNVTEWLCVVSKGYGAVQYDLIPQPNIIYLRGSVLSSNELNAEVSKMSSDGVVKLTQQVDLDAEGLKVQWAIDGGERNELTIGDETVLVLDEEGTALDVAEANDTTDVLLYLEGEAIDVSSINDNITLYLVDKESGEDIQKKVVPVVKDGADGKPVYVSPSMSSLVVKTAEHTENDGTTTVKTTEAIDSTIYCTLIYDDKTLVDIIDVSVSGFGAEEDELKSDGRVLIKITIPIGTLLTELSTEIVVTLTGLDTSGVEHKASVTIPVIPAMRGLAGPMGESGYFYYPANEWNREIAESDKGYAVDTNTQSAPFVFHNGLYYYRTTNELNYNADGVLYTPSEDVANASNPAWRVIPEYQAIYAKILMVNWAQLGKAVFWGDYMFSQKGILEGSTGMTDYVEDMFDAKGRLNGKFIPNLFFDFRSGDAKMNRLSMPFYDLPYGGKAAYKIDLGVSHCVKADINKIVFLPNPTEIKNASGVVYDDTILSWQEKEADGVLCTIMAKPKPSYTEKYKTPIAKLNMQKDAGNIPSIYSLDDNLTLVCADGRVSDHRSYYIEDMDVNGNENKVVYNPLKSNFNTFGQYDGKGYFLIEGVPVKFIVLEPGAILKLRSCYTTAGRYYTPAIGNGEAKETEGIFWVVENASDFAQINFTAEIYLDVDGNEGELQTYYVWSCPSNPHGDSPQLEIAYGSSFIRYVQSKGTDSLQSSDMLKAQWFVSNEGVGIEDSLFIEV